MSECPVAPAVFIALYLCKLLLKRGYYPVPKKNRGAAHKEFGNALHKWILEERGETVVLINDRIRSKAIESASEMDIGGKFEVLNKRDTKAPEKEEYFDASAHV